MLKPDAELLMAAEGPIQLSQLLDRSAGNIGRMLAGAVTRALAALDTGDVDAARNVLRSLLAMMNL